MSGSHWGSATTSIWPSEELRIGSHFSPTRWPASRMTSPVSLSTTGPTTYMSCTGVPRFTWLNRSSLVS